MPNTFIPKQLRGKKTDVSSKLIMESAGDTSSFFTIVKHRLLDVNKWSKICKLPLTTFTLMTGRNTKATGLAKEGYFIRINIPGPGPKIGNGYDWVKIERIVDETVGETQILSMTVRPSSHPLKPIEDTAHFFSSCATSTFQVKRFEKFIFAEIHGRNEITNFKTKAIADKIRNSAISFMAKIGFSHPQWKMLAEGLLTR